MAEMRACETVGICRTYRKWRCCTRPAGAGIALKIATTRCGHLVCAIIVSTTYDSINTAGADFMWLELREAVALVLLYVQLHDSSMIVPFLSAN